MTESISIVIPAFNEEATVESVVSEALSVLQTLADEYEVLVVDDGSTDDTGAIVDRLGSANDKVRVIHHARNIGFTGAIKTCYQNARCDLVFLAPADKQVDLSELRSFTALIGDCDIVVGHRFARSEPFYRSFNSWGFHLLCRIFFGIKLREISLCNLYRRWVLQAMGIESTPSSAMIQAEVIYKAIRMGCRIKEVGMSHYPRAAGKSKGANPGMIIRTSLEMLRLWWKLRVTG
jgi:glycosyltransferase involved in cell wall biosynthesis